MVRDGMMQRNIGMKAALREAFAALQAGRFAAARDAAAPWRGEAPGAVLHALGRAGAGDVAGGATALEALARANPAARHPVHDLVDLLRAAGVGVLPHLRAAVALRADDPGLLALLGAALAETGPMQEAVAVFRRAAGLGAGAAGWSNLGKALAAVGDFAGAEQAFGQAAALGGGDAQLGLNHAVARLKSGRLAEGWGLFRARHGLPGRAAALEGRELRGLEDVAGRTVLLLHDEGLGDTLQFIRYAPMLEALGALVVVEAPPALARLLAANGHRVVTGGRPAADAWCRVPDLPGVFGTTLATVPGLLPYLAADPALVAAWAGRLPKGGRRVGLVWAGAARRHDAAAAATDRLRSIAPGLLGPLLGIQGITWVSLQAGRPAPSGVFDPMPGVRDFADTAAIVAGLDMVVSVDTSVAHLAGAMGNRVLLLDRYDGCWRWLHGRCDSPWYPEVLRIVRQTTPGGWDDVMRRAAELVAAGWPSRSGPQDGHLRGPGRE